MLLIDQEFVSSIVFEKFVGQVEIFLI